MELVNVDSKYLDYYNQKSKNTTKDFGIRFYNSEFSINIFIPITSFKSKHDSIKKHDSKYHVLIDKKGDKKAVLKVSDYLVVGKYFEPVNAIVESIEQTEFEIIKKDKDIILRKLNDILKSSNKRILKEKQVYTSYEVSHAATTRRFSERYMNEIIYSVTLFENLAVTPQNIEAIINLSDDKVNVSGHDNMILSDAINSWNWILDTLDNSVDLDYIIDLNRRLAKNQALKVGQLRDSEGGFVHGSKYSPPIPNGEEVRQKINALLSNPNKLNGALEYFCYATKEQLFYDGNKRTSYLIANKILIENGIGVFYISEELKTSFNRLLNNHYNQSHVNVEHKDNLINFIISNCIIYE